jgi:hypothetical protein
MIIDALRISSLETNEDAYKNRLNNYLYREDTVISPCIEQPCSLSEVEDASSQEGTSTCKDLIIKYVDNARRDPSCTKYRTIRLSNKVFDRVASSDRGIDYILQCGFVLYFTDTDYVASIPLARDLEQMISFTSNN